MAGKKELKNSERQETPMMRQYNTFKAKYPDAILLFRVGDFFETFGEDAVKTSSILGIVLTKRSNGAASEVELAGFPHHALDAYLPKLVRAGYRVAICDQLEDPKLAKTIVKRGVTELVTPGVSYHDKTLDGQNNQFLCSLFLNGDQSGVAFLDNSTGEFYIAQGSAEYADKLIQHWKPSEVLLEKSQKKNVETMLGNRYCTFALDDWAFNESFGREMLMKHFGTSGLKGFGIDHMPAAIIAAGVCLHYLEATEHLQTGHINSLSRIDEGNFVWLDRFTIRNLELLQPAADKGKALADIIDFTLSPMGSRMLKRWIGMPLKDKATIEDRHRVVRYFLDEQEFAEQTAQLIKQTGDLERLISKLATGRVNPRELLHLRFALQTVQEIKALCEKSASTYLHETAEQLNPCVLLQEKIGNTLHADAPAVLNKGGVISSGVNDELDQLREIAFSGKDYLLKIQKQETEKTGISSLKVAFNNVFGYYLEVTNTHKDKVPAEWIRKQTLSNAERYITPELKEYEEKILGAEEKILALEQQIFSELVAGLSGYIQPVQVNAQVLARIDCLQGFAQLARKNSYSCPELSDDHVLHIKGGRHPVIERLLPAGEEYISNDIYLDREKQQILIITGPNMSGKSAVLRQTALIVILAQMGSFVPATHARIGIIDKIFTRVGATDNISSGESTFMVEMNETASILNNLSDRSLVLLDEIGRGTSTYDGISIAWSIAAFLHEHPQARAKTLFATHYHELNDMAARFPRIKNFHVSVKESGNKVLFIRKLAEGGSEHSFGIHVARMAGMPKKVLEMAEEVLLHLENIHRQKQGSVAPPPIPVKASQLSIFQLDDPAMEAIREVLQHTDINTLTPVEALFKLNEIKKMAGASS